MAILTGSGQGVGQSIAKALAGQGASLLINDINAEVARKTAEEIKEAFRTDEVVGPLLPFFFSALPIYAVITFVPEVSLWLPKVIMG